MQTHDRRPAPARTLGRGGRPTRSIAGRVTAAALGLVLASWGGSPGPCSVFMPAPAFAAADAGQSAAPVPEYSGARESTAADSSAPSPLSLNLADATAFADSAVHILYGPRRGDASNMLIIRVPRGTRQVPLLFDAIDMPRGATVAMELRQEDGKVLARCNVKLSEFARRRPVVVSAGARPLVPGKYSIRLAQVSSGRRAPSDPAVYAFELQHESR